MLPFIYTAPVSFLSNSLFTAELGLLWSLWITETLFILSEDVLFFSCSEDNFNETCLQPSDKHKLICDQGDKKWRTISLFQSLSQLKGDLHKEEEMVLSIVGAQPIWATILALLNQFFLYDFENSLSIAQILIYSTRGWHLRIFQTAFSSDICWIMSHKPEQAQTCVKEFPIKKKLIFEPCKVSQAVLSNCSSSRDYELFGLDEREHLEAVINDLQLGYIRQNAEF